MPSEPIPTISASRAMYLDFSSSLISCCFERLLDCPRLLPVGFRSLLFLRLRGDEDFLVPVFLDAAAIGLGHVLCCFSSAAAIVGGAMATFRLFLQEVGRLVLLLSIILAYVNMTDKYDGDFVGKIAFENNENDT